jgi:Rps23 Pro-64 3,4-dihydroxylase Tpa1-like proline 4-hydroxylase
MIDKIIPGGASTLTALVEKFADTYQKGDPFPNIAFNDFFREEYLNQVLAEFPDLAKRNTIHYENAFEKKFAGRGEIDFGPTTREFMHFLNSEPFLQFLQKLTGIEEVLISDPYYLGGGLHEIKRGGLLKIHVDFNKHPKLGLDRRLNVLIYLNKNWQESYGGHFELWDETMTRCVKKIPPTFNTLALFSTNHISYHGHPDPLNCPEEMSRKSLALYYYSNGRPQHEMQIQQNSHSTLFVERKNHPEERGAFVVLKTKNRLKNAIRSIVPQAWIQAIKPKSKDW